MTRLVEVPVQFDDRSFDQFVSGFAAAVFVRRTWSRP